MGNIALRRNTLIYGVDYTQVGFPDYGRAKAYGRMTPYQVDTHPTTHMLIEAAQDLHAADDSGFAFPAGQWWVRTYVDATIDPSWTIGWDSDYNWFAVPSTLPAGYTAVNKRNVFPPCSIITGEPTFAGGDLQSGAPSYGVLGTGDNGVVRTAGGAYQPTSTTIDPGTGLADFPYGPSNRGKGVALTTWTSHVSALNVDTKIGYHPGYRNVRVVARWPNAAYILTAAGDSTTTTVDGVAVTIAKTDLAFDGTWWTATRDLGACGTAAVGALKNALWKVNATVGVMAVAPRVNMDIYLSPRVDIPCIWSAVSGNTIIPGGIASGTVPGF